ncbi:MAG: LptF/LptG family permease [Alphaproteobacteria bacterium]|nr:LptF/LptG family permease [Alphaproteobacteria bacterium]
MFSFRITPSITFRYIFRRLLFSFFAVTPVVVAMVWITMSVRYIELITSDNVSFSSFFKLVLCVLPGVFAITLPLCFLIASIITLHSMQTDKEIIVMLTLGKRPISLFAPLLMLGCCISAVVLYRQTTTSPQAYKIFVDLMNQVKNQISVSFLKPRTFNVVGDSVIYVGERTGRELRDIFVSYIPEIAVSKKHTNIITAKKGEYIAENGNVSILFENGCRQELSKSHEAISTLKFESLTYDITPFFKRFYNRSQKSNAKTQEELLEQANSTTDIQIKQKYIAEYHARIISSITPVFNALIAALFLIVARGRGRGRREALSAFLLGGTCQAFVVILINTSMKNTGLIPYNYAAAGLVVVALFAIFLRREF